MNTEDIKLELFNQCKQYVAQRLERIQHTISDIQESLTSETKSTAGDKHETGRAMLQLEREKAGKQLAEVQKLQEILAKIDIAISSQPVHLGSLVTTSKGSYFISISAGQLLVNDTPYFAIAANSPIGRLLLGKVPEDCFVFNTEEITIQSVS